MEYLNKFNTVKIQLIYVSINFDNKLRALILLFPLPESWNGTVIVVVSDFVEKKMMKFNDVRDMILSEQICKGELGLTSGSILNAKNRSRTISN